MEKTIAILLFMISCGSTVDNNHKDVIETSDTSVSCIYNSECPCGSICLESRRICVFVSCEKQFDCPEGTFCGYNNFGVKTCAWKICEKKEDVFETKKDTAEVPDIVEDFVLEEKMDIESFDDKIDIGFKDTKNYDIPYSQTPMVILSWKIPEDSSNGNMPDMDLHFAHPLAFSGFDGDKDGVADPWFDMFYDCFWYNPNPNWGSVDPNVDDNPLLVNSEDSESLYFNGMEDKKVYKIGVNYFNAYGYGETYATIRVYLWKTLVFETSCKLNELDMWWVAKIEWPSGTVSMYDSNNQCRITANYKNPSFSPY